MSRVALPVKGSGLLTILHPPPPGQPRPLVLAKAEFIVLGHQVVVRTVAREVRPDKIILFGLYAFCVCLSSYFSCPTVTALVFVLPLGLNARIPLPSLVVGE